MESRCLVVLLCLVWHTALSKDFKLFVADSPGMIYALDENGVIVETISEDEQIFDVAVDAFELQRSGLSIVYSTVKNGTGRIIRHNIANNYSEVIVDVQVQDYEAHIPRLVVDPTSGNIFFSRVLDALQGYNSISAQTPYGDQVGILSQLDLPRDIAIHAGMGLLFWSDVGTSPFIGSASMDGTNAKKLITTDLDIPNGIAVDFQDDMLYWLDAGLQRIERCDFNGNEREKVFDIPGPGAMDLLIDGEYLYYSTTSNNEIIKVKISDFTDSSTFATLSDTVALDGMAVYSSDFLNQTINKDCSLRNGLGNCSNVCLPRIDGHTCSCDYDDVLVDDVTCESATQCTDQIANGQLSTSCTRFQFESCEVVCDPGFLEGVVNLACDGTEWDDMNPCKSVDLGGPCSAEGTVCATDYSKCDAETHTCVCLDGYRDTDGDQNNIGGTCIKVCPRLQLPPNGYVSNYYDSPLFDYLPRAENIEGTSVDINCSNHHTLFGQSRFQCLTGGVWDIDAMPECIKDCEALDDIPNAYPVQNTTFSHGSVAAISCHPGYRLNGQAMRTCNYGFWSEPTPVCEPVDCGKLDIPHGILTGSTLYSGNPRIECDEGYQHYNSTYCGIDGVWYDSYCYGYGGVCFPTECDICSLARPSNGMSSVDHHWPCYVFYGAVIEYACDFGFELSGPQERICQANGLFSGTQPECVLIDCPNLQSPENGQLSNESTSVGTYVTVSCDDGFMIFGDSTLVCLLGGTWTGTVGKCVDSCAEGTAITEINSVATCLSCPKGEYQPEKNQRTCLKCEEEFTTVKEGTVQKSQCFRESVILVA